MKRKKMKKFQNDNRKYIILGICLFIITITLIALFNNSKAKFVSDAQAAKDIDVALYALGEDLSKDILLDNLVPRSNPYYYTFTIDNTTDGNKISETDMFYDLSIVTTTNIPLRYQLYMRTDYDTSNGVVINDIISHSSCNVAGNPVSGSCLTRDEITTFGTDGTYVLEIIFDEQYDSYVYQDLIEAIRIDVKSEQVLS